MQQTRTLHLTLCAVVYLSGQWFVWADSLGRISGGNQVSLEDYPYVVNIWNGSNYIASGTIISPKCIITAAHVLSGIRHQDLRIYGAVKVPSCSKAFEARAKQVFTPVGNSQLHTTPHMRLLRRHGRQALAATTTPRPPTTTTTTTKPTTTKPTTTKPTTTKPTTTKPTTTIQNNNISINIINMRSASPDEDTTILTKLQESNHSCCGPELDIAVIVLEDPHCSSVSQIPIDQTPLKAGDQVTVAGWGYSDIFDEPNIALTALNSTVTPNDRCNLFWGTDSFSDNHFCVEEQQLGVRPTSRDAGGPAIRNGKQVGIISAVNTCSDALVPSVFTRLSSTEVKAFLRKTLNAC